MRVWFHYILIEFWCSQQEVLRAEIESLRSGTDLESAQKIRSLESTIETLENSHDQLSQSLESEKRKTQDAIREMVLKMEGLSRDHESKVGRVLGGITSSLNMQVLEGDSLKKRLQKYSDYDEIKRELEIMKVAAFHSDSFPMT